MTRDAQRGFTLLEVMVAFIIAALALAALVSAASGGLRGADSAAHLEQAVARARSHLAIIGHGAAVVPGTRSGQDGGGYRWRQQVTQLASIPAARAALYDVAVTISWDSDGRPRSFTLRTRLTQPMAPQPR